MYAATSHAEDALLIATIVLAIFTGGLWYATYKMSAKTGDAIQVAQDALDLDRKRWEADAKDRRERYARDCSVTVEAMKDQQGSTSHMVKVSNDGQHHIRQIEAWGSCQGSTSSGARLDYVAPHTPQNIHLTGLLGVDRNPVLIKVIFRDHIGQRWTLTPYGELAEYDGNPGTLFPRPDIKMPTSLHESGR